MEHAGTSSTGLHILHLEDNALDAELIGGLILQEWPDCVIRRADNRETFVAALHTERVDLVLSDFTLPTFDGLSALRLTRQIHPRLPFIFLSGSIGEDHAVSALKEGATDYVLKDRQARLVPAVRRALQESAEKQQRQHAEAQFRESQERFLKLAEQSSDVFWFVNPESGQIQYVSPAFEQVWGRPVQQLYDDPGVWSRAIHPADRARARLAYESCLRGESPRFEQEYRVIRPDGTERWVLDSGIPIYDASRNLIRISGIAKDVTDRKQAERHIREQAELIDKAHEAIYLRDLDDRVFYWNKSAERIFGFHKDEVLGRKITELGFRAGNIDHFHEAKRVLLAKGEWTGELHLVDRADQELDLQASWTLLRDDEGHPKSILCIDMDVTRQRALEKQFYRSQRQESVGMLAGGIAHDLNNMLAPILMAIELLKLRITDADSQRLLNVLESSAQHGAGLVRQVLAFSRGTDGERLAIAPKAVVTEVVKLLSETLPRTISLETDIADPLPSVMSNSTELGQVLMNLCVNARDAMPQGGRILIKAAPGAIDEAMIAAAPWARPGPCVVLSVHDNGSGIPPAIIDRIFDPFFTTKKLGKGTGLGLSTVLGIIKSQGGILQVRSTPGKGSEFLMLLPAESAGAEGSRPPPAVIAPEPAGGDQLILVIDDEQPVRAVARAILETHGFRVLEAEDGPTGLDLLRRHRDDIKAVITDLMMPGMQGAEVIARLRQLAPELGIVAMSGLVEKDQPEEEASGVVLLRKPMTAAQLVATVRQVLPTA